MILSPQNILVLLLSTTFICSRADDSCPDVKLLGVGESDKLAILRGCRGTPGHPGLQGPPGLPGHKGDLGPPGKAGDRGLTGEKGDKGVPGQMGKLGPIGEKGDQGALGKPGDRGLTGQKGDKGSQGITGDTGLTGQNGDNGAQGKTGDRGLNGQKGDQGTSGKKGDRGLTGEKGSKGEKGELFRAAKNCKELRDQGIIFSGWYTIYPDGMQPLMVLCDMITDEGGWIVFQRRVDGSEDFYQDWETYKRGFGNQATEFWLGNENIHRLTSGGTFQLRVDLEDFDNNRAYATYSDFSITGEGDFYRLKFDKFIEGTAGDSLSQHKDKAFTTRDKEKREDGLSLCTEYYQGAWWFYNCYHSHLNGRYLKGENVNPLRGVVWINYKGNTYSLKSSEMKFRPAKR
ncbi:ficolin-1-B-like isoform X1 [Ranitomeya variabilis]|uniref:ficolin-1-B-like isoform X1 n=1 Tax=Ranitomeya variabilis TaxID=490064 RepID=UPI004055F204